MHATGYEFFFSRLCTRFSVINTRKHSNVKNSTNRALTKKDHCFRLENTKTENKD